MLNKQYETIAVLSFPMIFRQLGTENYAHDSTIISDWNINRNGKQMHKNGNKSYKLTLAKTELRHGNNR